MNNKIVIEPNRNEVPVLDNLLEINLGNFLDHHELNLLLQHSHICSFEIGETILNQGELIEGIYIILEGMVLLTAQMMGQGVTKLETLHSGHFLSAIAFIEQGPCPTSFIATTDDVQCLFIPNSYFQILAVDYPETRYKFLNIITKQICARIKTTHDTVTSFISESDMMSLSIFERVIYSLNQPKKIIFEESGVDKKLLKNIPIFKEFYKGEIDNLLNQFIMFDVPKNCKLLIEGDKNASCYLVIYGAIQTCIIQNSKFAKLSVIAPGTLLASIGCVDQSSSFNITFITCEPTILLKLDNTSLQLIKKSQPELWYKLFNLICSSLTALKKSIDKLDIRLHTENYNR